MKSIFFLCFLWLGAYIAFAQNESAVRMADAEETYTIIEKSIATSSEEKNVSTAVQPFSVKPIEHLQKIDAPKTLTKPATSGKFLAKMKKNLKPQKELQEKKTAKEGKFWAVLFGLVSAVFLLLLFGEATWGIFLVSGISLIISLIANPDVGKVFAAIDSIISLILFIVGLSNNNGMAFLLGLIMLAFCLGLLGVGSASRDSYVIYTR
ncbi:MAG: hypothetical protein ACK40K_06255 [Raineya sp.]